MYSFSDNKKKLLKEAHEKFIKTPKWYWCNSSSFTALDDSVQQLNSFEENDWPTDNIARLERLKELYKNIVDRSREYRDSHNKSERWTQSGKDRLDYSKKIMEYSNAILNDIKSQSVNTAAVEGVPQYSASMAEEQYESKDQGDRYLGDPQPPGYAEPSLAEPFLLADVRKVYEEGYKAVGLTNPRVSCWLNSSIQVLFSIVPFRNYILGFIGATKESTPNIYHLREMFSKMVKCSDRRGKYLAWRDIEENIRGLGYKDCGGAEYVNGLISECQKEDKGDKKIYEEFKFNVSERTTHKYEGWPECWYYSERNYEEMFLPQCRGEKSVSEILDENYAMKDGKNTKEEYALRGEFPNILIVHSNFKFGFISDEIINLDDSKFGMSEDPKDKPVYSYTYELIAVLQDHTGHFSSYTKNLSDGSWTWLDDARVIKVSFEHVKGAMEGCDNFVYIKRGKTKIR